MTLVVVLGGLLLATGAGVMLRKTRQARERTLFESNQFAADIIENAGEGIVVYDSRLRALVWNHAMEELTGLRSEDVIGRAAADLFPQLGEDEVEPLLRRALGGETVASSDSRYTAPLTGRQGWVSAVYRPHRDSDGNVAGVIGLVRDITARKAAEQEVEYQAYHDACTGLANRRLFQEHLSLAIALAGRRQRHVAVLFLDLDHFKLINDSLGHSVGDALLRDVAARIRNCVREGDTVARVGGDEFTIVLQELGSRDGAAIVAEKVLKTIEQPFEVAGHRLYVTTSIGITLFPDDGLDAETLLKNADAALYRAKEDGRNTYRMSTEELSRWTSERMQLENDLHRAVENEEFELYYQPQVDLRTMRVTGMEALLRWRHPERGLLEPASFISVAEERGFIVLIGDWVLRTACREARRVRETVLPEFRVAVNISARQFHDDTLVRVVEGALRESGLDPEALELEITESVAMENLDRTVHVLSRLRQLGVTIAIDDFGTGHSSLNYLKRFPIDALKIDRGFVADLPDRFEDAAIVESVIRLAAGLKLRVVAEGVESRTQLEFLTRHDCGEVQGYYFSVPVPGSEIVALLAEC